MAENKFVVCFNALEKRFFEVAAVHLVGDFYRRNCYKLTLRLNFYDEVNRINDMRQFCLRKITNLMTERNMWQSHHSFYVIEYEIRVISRKRFALIQHKGSESSDDSVSSDDSQSSFEADEFTNRDSAYSSSSEISMASNESSDDSVHYWEDETIENVDLSDTLTSIDEIWDDDRKKIEVDQIWVENKIVTIDMIT